MSRVQKFRMFVTERLNATLEEILSVFEKTVVKYEEEAALCQEVISRQHALLCALHKPLMDQPTADAFTQQLLSRNEQRDQENPEEPACAEGQLQVLDETDIIQFTYNPRRPGETADPAAIGTARLKPAGPDQEVQLVSSETEDSDDYSRDSPDPGSASTRLVPKTIQGAGFSCRVCSRTFKARQFLFRHLKAHLQDGEHFDATENLKLHVHTHHTAQKQKREPKNQTKTTAQTRNQTRTRERRLHKPRTKVHAGECCDNCGKTFLQVWKKRRHRCVLTGKSRRGKEGGDVTRKSQQIEEGGDVMRKSRQIEGGDVMRKSRQIEGGDVMRKSRQIEEGGDVMRKSRQIEGGDVTRKSRQSEKGRDVTRKSRQIEEGGDVMRKSRQIEEGGDVMRKSRQIEGGDVTRKSRQSEKGRDVTRKSRQIEEGGDVTRKSRQKEGKLNLRHQKFES